MVKKNGKKNSFIEIADRDKYDGVVIKKLCRQRCHQEQEL
jgi:hypothetical protein